MSGRLFCSARWSGVRPLLLAVCCCVVLLQRWRGDKQWRVCFRNLVSPLSLVSVRPIGALLGCAPSSVLFSVCSYVRTCNISHTTERDRCVCCHSLTTDTDSTNQSRKMGKCKYGNDIPLPPTKFDTNLKTHCDLTVCRPLRTCVQLVAPGGKRDKHRDRSSLILKPDGLPPKLAAAPTRLHPYDTWSCQLLLPPSHCRCRSRRASKLCYTSAAPPAPSKRTCSGLPSLAPLYSVLAVWSAVVECLLKLSGWSSIHLSPARLTSSELTSFTRVAMVQRMPHASFKLPLRSPAQTQRAHRRLSSRP